MSLHYSRHLCIDKEGALSGGSLATKGGERSIDGVRKDNGGDKKIFLCRLK